MKKNIGIGATIPNNLFLELNVRADDFPKGKSGILRKALELYFVTNAITPDQKVRLEESIKKSDEVVI